jgi:GNAT superfamily N-acetyltransferase
VRVTTTKQASVLTHRVATLQDRPALDALAAAAIEELQRTFLQPDQIIASRAIMGIDTRLIEDGTYFAIEADGTLAGCGGWSRRATLYGGDHTSGRDNAFLDPRTEPARIRAMYTHPAFVRRGIGRLILSLCEAAAATEGFTTLELMATLAGQPLYTNYGFTPIEHTVDTSTGTAIPLVRMSKPILVTG